MLDSNNNNNNNNNNWIIEKKQSKVFLIINYDKATVSNLSALSRLCQKDTTQFLSTIFAESAMTGT